MNYWHAAREAQLVRKERKALSRTHGLGRWVYVKANGHREMERLSARGWFLINQDPALSGMVRHQFLMCKERLEVERSVVGL